MLFICDYHSMNVGITLWHTCYGAKEMTVQEKNVLDI